MDDDEMDDEPAGKGPFPYDGWDKPIDVRKPDKKYSPHYKGDNSGGYGNSPVSGQFKKGNPGGPGRPKGSTSLASAMKKAFRRKLPAMRDGKVKKLHPTEVLAERILEAALAKNLTPAMIGLARSLMEEYGPQVPETQPPPLSTKGFSKDELNVLSALLGRALGDKPGVTRRHVLGTISEPYPTGMFELFRREDGHLGLRSCEIEAESGSQEGS